MRGFFSSLLRRRKGDETPKPSRIQKPSLSNFVRTVCVPKWYAVFSDEKNGGFYERLNADFTPVPLGYKRVLTQCRQLYIYTHADAPDGKPTHKYLPKLRAKYDFLVRHYRQPNCGWSFAVRDDGAPYDGTLDLYAQAFVILSLSQYARASGNADAAAHALDTAHLIDRHFRVVNGDGFYEALDADLRPIQKMRRQNPHMHLLEACLFAYDTTRAEIYATLAHDIYALFTRFFFDDETGTLREFFADDLTPHPVEGHRLEAGHHFEWVWLLDYYRRQFPEHNADAFRFMERLYDWGCSNGYDRAHGGIFDEQDRYGNAIKDTKRVWPLCEAIKAHRAMRPYQPSRALDLLEKTKKILKENYIKRDGSWVESWNKDFSEITVNYLPGTSVYHL